MTVSELIEALQKFDGDYRVEIKEGTDHWTPGVVKKDGKHKKGDFWQRQRKVVYIEPQKRSLNAIMKDGFTRKEALALVGNNDLLSKVI